MGINLSEIKKINEIRKILVKYQERMQNLYDRNSDINTIRKEIEQFEAEIKNLRKYIRKYEKGI